jgi:hypothetical protein
MKKASVRYFASFDHSGPGEVNHVHGGRVVNFDDLDGHLLQLITEPYGTTMQR